VAGRAETGGMATTRGAPAGPAGAAADVPRVLRSRRLRLEPVTERDMSVVHRHWNEDLVRRHLWDDGPVALETVASLVAASAGGLRTGGCLLWCVRLCGDPALVGTCALRRDGGGDEIELAYSVEPAHWGRGLATEAAGAVLAFAFGTLGLEEVVAVVDVENVASAHVAARIGMRGRDTDDRRSVRFAISRSEHAGRRPP
jgi:RimJ/RimL family protein N-acetyltransferase